MSRPVFKKKLLASCVAAACSASMSMAAQAQGESVDEEVVVFGIRGALERSADIKRESVGVVDAISAEDIGQFPDTNLAESLQRITGVSIDRSRSGEGQQITVRGFGGSNNVVLLNGRHIASSQNPDGGSPTRAFDFSNLASEAVSGVEVYKTAKANVATGGIGATVNVKTLRPLDRPGMHLTAGIKAVNDTTNRTGDDITPEISGLFSWTDDNETFGLSLTHISQERDSGTGGGFVTQWNTQAWSSADYATVGTINNEPTDGDLWSRPSDFRYFVDDISRERSNTMLTLQFAPSDRVTATLDYVMAEQSLRSVLQEQSVWFNDGALVEMTFQDGPVATPVLWSEDRTGSPGDLSFAQQIRDNTNELDALGVNVEFQATDALNLTFDFSDSTSTSEPSTFRGQKANASAACFCLELAAIDWTAELPSMMVGVVGGSYGPADMTTTRGEADWVFDETTIQQLQIGGTLELADSKLDFGVETREMENHFLFARIQPVFGDWGGLNPADVPDSFWTPGNILGQIDGFSSPGGFTEGMRWDWEEVVTWAEDRFVAGDIPGSFADFPDGRFQPDRIWENDRLVNEDITSFFAQWSTSFDLGGKPANFTAGVRYETTDVEATSAVAFPTSIEWESDNDFEIFLDTDTTLLTRTGDYDHTLPNLDLDVALSDDLKARFSYSTTIGRANYDDLQAGVSGFNRDEQTTNAVGGNPGLVPLESDNIDISLEWYYADSSYASVGYFQKDVANFIGETVIPLTDFGVADPFEGSQRSDSLTSNGGPCAAVDLVCQHNYVSNLRTTGMGNPFLGDYAEGDPEAIFMTTVPTNDKKAKFDGFELAVQHMFGESGFGGIINYTVVDADVSYDLSAIGDQFALTGLSDSYNLVGFYDKDGLQARLAYNWRDEFLDTTASRGLNEPGFTEEYSQLDMSVSYDVNEDMVVFLEGLNLTDENQRRHGRSTAQLIDSRTFGARYQIGLRYTFF